MAKRDDTVGTSNLGVIAASNPTLCQPNHTPARYCEYGKQQGDKRMKTDISIIPCSMTNSLIQDTELKELIHPCVYFMNSNKKTLLTNAIDFAKQLSKRVIVLTSTPIDPIFRDIIGTNKVEQVTTTTTDLYSSISEVIDSLSLEDCNITVVYPFMDYSIFTSLEIEDIRRTGNLIASTRNISGNKGSEVETDQRPPLVVSLNETQVSHVFCDMPEEETIAMVTHVMPVFRFRSNYDETNREKVMEWVSLSIQDNPDATNTLKKCSFFSKIRIIHPILR
jgi:hypothetical protein